MKVPLGVTFVLMALLLLLWRSWQPRAAPERVSHRAAVAQSKPRHPHGTVPAEPEARSVEDLGRINSAEGSSGPLPDLPSPEPDPDADAVADERRKILEYSAATKLADLARARVRLVEANLAIQRGLFPGAPHLVDLERLLDSEWAEADRLSSEVSRIAKEHRILDLADLPPEEREAVLFVDDPGAAP